MNTKEIINSYPNYIMNTYGRQSIVLSHGKGTRAFDLDGNEYLDLFAGIAVNNLGHSHPNIVNAIKDQAEKMIHCSNVYYTPQQLELAELLAKISPNDEVFYQNSGAEANEGAIKLARKFTGKGEIISANNSFHGRTIATITATGQPKYSKDYKPLPEGFIHVPFGDLKAIKDAINDNTAAVLLEAIQGEGGVNIPPENYLKEVENICKEKDVLFILDEVQTGFGRCGKMFASEIFNLNPDITTVAKGIAGGFPMGAILANHEIAKAFIPGDHGSTFGGSPLACATAIASINTILDENLLENSKNLGEYFKNKLLELKEQYDVIVDVRGYGLMIGLELSIEGASIVDEARKNGFLINCTADKVLRFVPPLIITKIEIDRFIIGLNKIFSKF
ncbi:aspartate aminotransferase family protein [Methanobrevibacter curvatus]|uniref:Acetylornithine aminotransferase n=1 Tax=Methanobrevibacter curvatus TaxID=49547 RepID=A0A165YZA7_9EURY|nr:aspartate aminotransferase family protein [Methanobrevibacter curvatus]KZX10054.1 acetylornithine aminotransferase [Methanobrevibacter curvatus]